LPVGEWPLSFLILSHLSSCKNPQKTNLSLGGMVGKKIFTNKKRATGLAVTPCFDFGSGAWI
jgi:hypothetical protein